MNCDICKSTINLTKDYDRVSNKERGIVCSDCSIILKIVKDDTDYLNDIINYIYRFDKKNNQFWANRFWDTKNNF